MEGVLTPGLRYSYSLTILRRTPVEIVAIRVRFRYPLRTIASSKPGFPSPEEMEFRRFSVGQNRERIRLMLSRQYVSLADQCGQE